MTQQLLFEAATKTAPARIVLVGCGDLKQDHACAAKDLYRSGYFKLARRYAESTGEEWGICSAGHGYLKPDAIVEPYNKTLRTKDDRRGFRNRFHIEMLWLFDELGITTSVKPGASHATWDNAPVLICLAGATYANEIRAAFHGSIVVEEPLSGLQIGERQAWFSNALKGAA